MNSQASLHITDSVNSSQRQLQLKTKQKDNRFGKPRVVLKTSGGSKAKPILKESERTDWFHAMVSEGQKRTQGKTVYDKYAKKRRNRRQDISEYFFKRAYGYSVNKQKQSRDVNEDKGALVDADRTIKQLQDEYDEFIEKIEQKSKMTMMSGIHDVSEESDSYDSEDSAGLRKSYLNHSFLDDEIDKERSNLKFKNMAMYRALKEGETQVYVDIDNDLLDLPFKKGMACNDEQIEHEERDLIQEIEAKK